MSTPMTLPVLPTLRAARKLSNPAPDPRSRTTSPSLRDAKARGLPQPRPRFAPSGTAARSASEYPSPLLISLDRVVGHGLTSGAAAGSRAGGYLSILVLDDLLDLLVDRQFTHFSSLSSIQTVRITGPTTPLTMSAKSSALNIIRKPSFPSFMEVAITSLSPCHEACFLPQVLGKDHLTALVDRDDGFHLAALGCLTVCSNAVSVPCLP